MNIKIIQKKSPNFDKRPKGSKINSVVIHYTGMKTFNEAFKRLCDNLHYFRYSMLSVNMPSIFD